MKKPDEFKLEDFGELKSRYGSSVLGALEAFKRSCPCSFDDFSESEQVLMSFAFCEGFYYCMEQVKMAMNKNILHLDINKACQEIGINDPHTS